MLQSLVRGFAVLAVFLASLPVVADFPIKIQATARLDDGHIVVAGMNAGTLAYMRLNADGSRDGNWPYTSVYGSQINTVTGVVALPNGGMIFSGAGYDGTSILVAVDSYGYLDQAFGSGGVVADTQTNGLRINALLRQPDGTLLGFGTIPAATSEPTTAVVVRYSANGTRDMTLGSGGLMTPLSTASEFHAAIALADGSIIAAGYDNVTGARQLALVKVLGDLSLDASFGISGVATTSPGDYQYSRAAYGLAVVGTDLVAVGGERLYYQYDWNRLFTARFSATGSLVSTASRVIPASYGDAIANATSVVAIDADSYVVGAQVLFDNYDQRRVLWRYPSGELVIESRAQPQIESIAALHATAAGQVVALGGSDVNYYGEMRRTRYFSDNFQFDTDFAQDGYDSTPNPIVFAAVTGAATSQAVTSAPFRITGIDQPGYASVSGGSYSIGCVEPFTTDPLVLSNGQVVCLRVTSGETGGITTTATITVNDTSGSFSVSTVGPPDTFFTQSVPAQTGRYVVFFYNGDTASGPITGYECSLDSNPFVTCPTNNHVQAGPLEPGPHTFQIRAINSFGTDPTPAVASFTVLPPPETTITSGPGAVSGPNVTFAFSSSEPDAHFMCYLDGNEFGPFEACSSPKTFASLSGGSHTFRVYAIGAIDNDSSPAVLTWTVDRTPPDTRITSGPSATYSATATFVYDAMGETAATFECQLDGAAWYACPGGSTSVTVTPDVQHLFSVRAIDEWGNADATPATRGWIYYSQLPDTSITSGPSGTLNITGAAFTYQATNNPALFACSLSGPTGNPAFVDCPSGGITYFNLAEGTYTFSVRARSNDGTTDATPAQRTFIVDRTPPTISITSGPSGTVNSAAQTFEFAANESGVSFACWLDGAPQGACTSPVTYSGLADGSHTVQVAGSDLAGNNGAAASRTWQIDRTGPDTTITSAPSGTVATAAASIAFTSEAGALFDCRLDNAAFGACTSPVSYSGLADGGHTFEVRARDAVGNTDPSPASATWSVDTTAPDTSIASGPSGTTASAAATFTFQSNDAGAAFECSLDGASFAACASGISYAGLANGMHMFDVRARDAAGNVDATPAERSWSVDTAAPNTTITSGPAAVTASTAATFVFTSTEPGAYFCALDGAQYAACTSPVTYAGLSSTSHAFAVYAVDGVGNADASAATWSWIVDNQAPETTITATPSAVTNSTSASFSFSSSESGSTFECKLDAGPFAACSSPRSYSGLASGSHTFQVRAADSLGNQDASAATFTWTVDTTAPDTMITAGPSGNNNPSPFTFSFSSTESNSTFECKMDTAAFAACASPVSYSGLAKGQHTFQVRARDAAGNLDATPASRTFGAK